MVVGSADLACVGLWIHLEKGSFSDYVRRTDQETQWAETNHLPYHAYHMILMSAQI